MKRGGARAESRRTRCAVTQAGRGVLAWLMPQQQQSTPLAVFGVQVPALLLHCRSRAAIVPARLLPLNVRQVHDRGPHHHRLAPIYRESRITTPLA